MYDMSSTLIPILVAMGLWSAYLLRLEGKWRALVVTPFALAACMLAFWRIPMKSELQPYLDILSVISAVSIAILAVLTVRRNDRGDDQAQPKA